MSNAVRKIIYIARSANIKNFEREKKTEMKYSLEELLVMVIPTFVDLQEFVVNKKFIKEVAVLKQGTVFTHYIFTNPVP